MKSYIVKYYFDGRGEATVFAENEDEAKQKFIDGEFEDKDFLEWAEGETTIDEVEEQEDLGDN